MLFFVLAPEKCDSFSHSAGFCLVHGCWLNHSCVLRTWKKTLEHVPCGDTVLWSLLWEYRVPNSMTRAVQPLYDQCQSLVCISCSKSDLFVVRVGRSFVTDSVYIFLLTEFLGKAKMLRGSGLWISALLLCFFHRMWF